MYLRIFRLKCLFIFTFLNSRLFSFAEIWNFCIFHPLKTKDLIWIHCLLTHAKSKNLNQAVWLVKLTTIFLLLKEKSESISCSVVPNSLRFYGLQPIRLPCPWNSPGKNTGVGCHFLLQRIFLTQGLNHGCLHCKPSDSLPSEPPGKAILLENIYTGQSQTNEDRWKPWK